MPIVFKKSFNSLTQWSIFRNRTSFPFNQLVSTKVGQKFLHLIDNHFHKSKRLSKIFKIILKYLRLNIKIKGVIMVPAASVE